MAEGMTLAGWIFMVTTWSAVITLLAFCFRRVLRNQSPPDR